VVESPADKVLREGVVVGLANHTILIRKDGSEIAIDDSGAPIKTSDGRITGVVLVFRDMTERKEIERREREMITVEERQRLARELHDSVTQSMFSANTRAELIPRIWERDPEKALGYLNEVITLNRGAMAEMRALLLELRPDAIMNNSLDSLYEQLVTAAPTRKPINANLTIEGEPWSLPPEAHVAFYRIAQESVNNALKHGEANNLKIEMVYLKDEVQVSVVDDGRGFDVTSTSGGLGLISMRERAESIGAVFELASNHGQGTTVRVRWSKASTA
jgi:signal transduction histidine kinase